MASSARQQASCSACQGVPGYAQLRPIPRGGTNGTGQRPVPRPKSGSRGPGGSLRVLDGVQPPALLPLREGLQPACHWFPAACGSPQNRHDFNRFDFGGLGRSTRLKKASHIWAMLLRRF